MKTETDTRTWEIGGGGRCEDTEIPGDEHKFRSCEATREDVAGNVDQDGNCGSISMEMMKKKRVIMEFMMKGIWDSTIPLLVNTGETMQTQKMRVQILY